MLPAPTCDPPRRYGRPQDISLAIASVPIAEPDSRSCLVRYPRYSLSMAAKVSDRGQELVTQAAELGPPELVALAEAIDSLLHRDETVADRHAVIAERIARGHSGQAATLSMKEVERTVRDELDF